MDLEMQQQKLYLAQRKENNKMLCINLESIKDPFYVIQCEMNKHKFGEKEGNNKIIMTELAHRIALTRIST